jgi:hypothetical protein
MIDPISPVLEETSRHAPAAFDGGADAPEGIAGEAGGLSFGLNGASWPVARESTSAVAFLGLIVAVTMAAIGAMIAGGTGSPVFSLGLAFGFAVGAVPYGVFVIIHASSSYAFGDHSQRRRRMTDDEWQRIFGPREAAGSTGSASGGEAGWSATPGSAGAALDEALAYEFLGLSPEATMKQITRAYHRLAHLYHPDKTVGQSDDARVLAEQRMKELNAAYELLRSRTRASVET